MKSTKNNAENGMDNNYGFVSGNKFLDELTQVEYQSLMRQARCVICSIIRSKGIYSDNAIEEDIQDISHEAIYKFISILMKEKYDPSRAGINTYFSKIVRNTFIDWVMKNKTMKTAHSIEDMAERGVRVKELESEGNLLIDHAINFNNEIFYVLNKMCEMGYITYEAFDIIKRSYLYRQPDKVICKSIWNIDEDNISKGIQKVKNIKHRTIKKIAKYMSENGFTIDDFL